MKELYQKNILDFLTLQLNKPYIWGNIGPDSFDCSGLTKYIYIHGGGYYIDLEPRRMVEIEAIASK